ncbi:MAG: hypothetical protein JKX84_05750 [Flavobacteriales bacterium]|nr:hypothetical protein [Flavobacteriales bacterium]
MKFNNRNVQISKKARIGNNVQIGDNTIIYDNVEIGNNTTICNDCILGEPTASFYSDPKYENEPTFIGANSLVRSHAIIYAGAYIGDHFQSGHRITIREASFIGNGCRIGTLSDLQGYLKIGDNCHLHSNVHLCQKSELKDHVFLYPFSVLMNDKYPPSTEVMGPTIDNYSQIGAHAVIAGNIKIGKHCLVGASSNVTKDFDDYSFLTGSPARLKSDVRNLKNESGDQLYPWKERFSRGMPWEKP